MPLQQTTGLMSAKGFGFGSTQGIKWAWNPSYINSYFALSNGNLTATATGYHTGYGTLPSTSQWGNVFGTYAITTGQKIMFSCKMNVWNGLADNDSLGVGFLTAPISSLGYYPGFDANSVGFYDDGLFYYNGSTTSFTPTFQTNNDNVDIAVDNVNQTIWYRVNGGNWNGSPSANPTTNTGGQALGLSGTVYPLVSSVISPYVGQWTINTISPYSPPSGFTFIG